MRIRGRRLSCRYTRRTPLATRPAGVFAQEAPLLAVAGAGATTSWRTYPRYPQSKPARRHHVPPTTGKHGDSLHALPNDSQIRRRLPQPGFCPVRLRPTLPSYAQPCSNVLHIQSGLSPPWLHEHTPLSACSSTSPGHAQTAPVHASTYCILLLISSATSTNASLTKFNNNRACSSALHKQQNTMNTRIPAHLTEIMKFRKHT